MRIRISVLDGQTERLKSDSVIELPGDAEELADYLAFVLVPEYIRKIKELAKAQRNAAKSVAYELSLHSEFGAEPEVVDAANNREEKK